MGEVIGLNFELFFFCEDELFLHGLWLRLLLDISQPVALFAELRILVDKRAVHKGYIVSLVEVNTRNPLSVMPEAVQPLL